jgi:sugar (pentulose or hexulose) kinase
VKPLVIGIDSSTTTCRAIAWDCDGQIAAEGRSSHTLNRPAPNWYEQDAEQWWTSACQALRQVLGAVDARRIEALCVTHQRESFVPVLEDGRPSRSAILWLDERSRSQVAFLESEVGRERFHAITGKPLTTNPSITKIAWLLEHEPESVPPSSKILDAHAFLTHRFTGEYRTSLASADPTGLVDLRAGEWAIGLLEVVGLSRTQLPDLVLPGTVIGHVTSHAAEATGLQPGLPVIAGAGDGQCAGLGVHASSGGRASLNLGTAVVSGRTSEDYLTTPAFRTLHAASEQGYFLETVIQGGAFTISWFADHFGLGPGQTSSPESAMAILEEAAAGVPAGATGLMLVPYWNHAMTPYWDPAASGITIGWTGAHGPEHLYRAILEGIAFEQRLLGEGVGQATGRETSEYVAMGGGSRNDLWCQILADVTGVPILRAATPEATCLGAGILAAAAVGWYPDVERAARAMTGTTDGFSPGADTAQTYDLLYTDVYRHLYPKLQTLLHRLADIRDGAGIAAQVPN